MPFPPIQLCKQSRVAPCTVPAPSLFSHCTTSPGRSCTCPAGPGPASHPWHAGGGSAAPLLCTPVIAAKRAKSTQRTFWLSDCVLHHSKPTGKKGWFKTKTRSPERGNKAQLQILSSSARCSTAELTFIKAEEETKCGKPRGIGTVLGRTAVCCLELKTSHTSLPERPTQRCKKSMDATSGKFDFNMNFQNDSCSPAHLLMNK